MYISFQVTIPITNYLHLLFVTILKVCDSDRKAKLQMSFAFLHWGWTGYWIERSGRKWNRPTQIWLSIARKKFVSNVWRNVNVRLLASEKSVNQTLQLLFHERQILRVELGLSAGPQVFDFQSSIEFHPHILQNICRLCVPLKP